MDHIGNNNSSIVACRSENSAAEYYRRSNSSYKNEVIISSHPLRILNPFSTTTNHKNNLHINNCVSENIQKNKQGCIMNNKRIPLNVFFISVLVFWLLPVFSFITSPVLIAQEVLNSIQIEQMKLTGDLKNDGSLWVRDYKNDKGEVSSLTVFDISEDLLKAVTKKASKADINNDDAVAKFNCFGKPVLVCKYGIIALRRLSMETIADSFVWPVEITSVNLTAYPNKEKEGWGILEINGKKELVVYHQRGSEKLIRPYREGKDPS
jgi:hypothetical protein